MTAVERKGNGNVGGLIKLGAVFAVVTCASAADATTSMPSSLTCRPDGTTNQVSYVYLPLPIGFKSLTGAMSRPRMANGNYVMRLMLVDHHTPSNHRIGLVSDSLPPPPPGRPLFGYGLRLREDSGEQTRNAELGWLIVPDEFRLRMDLKPQQLTARLTWEFKEKPYDYEYAIESVRADYKRLALGCWNGDFELSDIRFETQ